MWRDFTYVEDLVRGIRLLIDAVPQRPATRGDIAPGDSLSPVAPFRIVNIGNSEKIRLEDFVEAIEQELGKRRFATIWRCKPAMYPPPGQMHLCSKP
jgi:UDP-glucuronate 4-epimerase